MCSFSDKQGTNRAFINKADGSGQSTKGRVQMLADIRGSAAAVRAAKHRNFVPLPNAGAMGTNKAFVNKGDGKGLRGTSKLSGFGTDAAFLHKADGSGQSTKGKTQQLYEWTGGESQQLMPPFVLLCLSTRVHVRHALPCSVCFVVCCGFADVDLVP